MTPASKSEFLEGVESAEFIVNRRDGKYKLVSKHSLVLSRRDLFAGAALITSAALVRPWGSVNAQSSPPSPLPRPSEISFSARFTDPRALPLARSFGATRLDWTYSLDRSFLAAARTIGISVVGGTINACMPDVPGGNTFEKGRMQTREGHPITADWMAGESVFRSWGCPNNPAYESIALQGAIAALNAGSNYIQFDDPAMSIPAVAWGGCWCEWCKKRASELGYSLTHQMLIFQKQSTKDFIMRLRGKLSQAVGRRIVMSSNNFEGLRSPPYDLFEFGMCELTANQLNFDSILRLYNSYEYADWRQVVTLKTSDPFLARACIATVHAAGGNCIVPWDVFIATGKRYFGSLSDYGEVYAMVRTLGSLLDEKRFASGGADSVLTNQSVIELADIGIKTIVREDDYRLIAHFIPWGTNKSQVKISLKSQWTNSKIVQILGNRSISNGTTLEIPSDRWTALVIEKSRI